MPSAAAPGNLCSLGLRASCRSFFFFQAEDGIRDGTVTGVQTCALPICDPNKWASLAPFHSSAPESCVPISKGFPPERGERFRHHCVIAAWTSADGPSALDRKSVV